ncbi:MAG: DUF4038 domain-containing protein [Sphingobacteriales bacterium]|nr:MAG: DUF4038 domain-containing protein [Sphingobacteriales bacterium]
MVYTYFRGFNKAWTKHQPDVYEVSWKEYSKAPIKPFVLGESTYEGEHGDWGSALQARKQAYWAVLGGSTGHAYGSPLWKFDTPWKKYLNLPGALSLKHFYTFFSSLSWYKLVPDTSRQIAVSGMGEVASNDYAVTAISSDRSFLVSYLPSSRAISINLSQLKPRRLFAQWFNPLSGERLPKNKIYGKGIQKFQAPALSNDWVLLIN